MVSEESFEDLIRIDPSERLRRLKKKQIVDVFRNIINKMRKDSIIDIILENSSFEKFLENSSSRLRANLLFEPRSEREMKTAVGDWLKENGWDTGEEIPITEDSVADIVGFQRGGRLFGEDLICAVELKRAAASKLDIDRGFRQINDYLRGADYVYLAVTPLLLWQKGPDFFIRRVQPLNAGLIVADGQKVLNVLEEPKKSKFIDENIWESVWEYYEQ